VVERLATLHAEGRANGPRDLWYILRDVRDLRTIGTVSKLLSFAQTGSLGFPPKTCAARTPELSEEKRRFRCYETDLASALKNIHSEETLPLLLRLLESPDRETQQVAVQGFALAALRCKPGPFLGCPAPGFEELHLHSFALRSITPGMFFANSSEYLSYWKRWYADHQSEVP